MEPQMMNLIPLSIPVPPEPLLERALGYTGEARFMATWWQPEGDDAMVSDGLTTATGQWQGYLAFVDHEAVHLHLMDYELGSSERPARHWLVIDRQERRAWIGKNGDARAFLQAQWPENHRPLSPEEMQELWEGVNRWLANTRDATVGEVLEWMEQNRQAVAALTQWLDGQKEQSQ